MNRLTKHRPGLSLPVVTGLALLATAGAIPAAAQQGADFLLGAPKVALTIKAGFAQPRAGSGGDTESLWDFTREQLTVDTRDFGGTSIAGELAVRASERVDVTLSFGYSLSSTRSEFRDWVDLDDLPIKQTTEFSTFPLTVGVKAYLLDRGRALGRFAYIPRTWNPYVGVAGGAVWYRFEQYGDFVDFETLDIFTTKFRSTGRGATVHLLGGMDVSINKHMMLVGEGRYALASAPLDRDFVGFPDLDLAGFQITVGISLRY
ncbi:MAG: outer membrane beta-barrel protein [Gemmatimonadetes bacterium]|nr:outer membrane beta-barrel protein [Gemmatimonadota bacterium]